MKLKSIIALLILTLLLAACGNPISTFPVVTENPTLRTTYPEPVNSTVPANPYPQPVVENPVPTTPAYPEPGTPGTGTPEIPTSGYEPQPGDGNLKRDQVFLDLASSQIVTTATKSSPVKAILQGNLSDPCHSLRVVVTPPDASNVIILDVYSVVDPGVACITVLKSFTASIPLGSYSSGKYSVMVNGENLGEFGTGYEPQPGDDQLTRGEAFVDMDNSSLLVMESYPIQVSVLLKGDLPTPCNQLRVFVMQPNQNNAINLEVYSLVDPAVKCIDVLQPFEVTIPLGSYSSGHYSVFVNGKLLGEIDA